MAKSAAMILMVALISSMVALTAAQSSEEIPKCATELTSCLSYLNSTTTPPATCCTPLKSVVTNEKDCLCGIYNNPTVIQNFGINVTHALNLITLCHVDTIKDPSTLCKAVAPSSSKATPSSGSAPKSSPGSASTSSPPGNAATKITGVGLITISIVFWAYTLFY
ncbi:non-specific lipid transfer protein GPI-anchored 7-like [Amaranthus tricolor]|uniref:non-specific lipid transfer protein GPI-anchored 7-like n=1 Tax=Amaranthus tricolor TaxID=29722 RepID=UPI00258CBA62|nr:non-specific lipid transfer protein GPI-anchored 7-like [Amaranthus tricolor]